MRVHDREDDEVDAPCINAMIFGLRAMATFQVSFIQTCFNRCKVLSLSVVDGVLVSERTVKEWQLFGRYRRRYRVKVKVLSSCGGRVRVRKVFLASNLFPIACIIPFVASLFCGPWKSNRIGPEVVERIDQKLEKDIYCSAKTPCIYP